MRIAVPNTCQSLAGPALDHLLAAAGHSGFLNPALGLVLLPGDALGVDPQQDVDAVASPLGDLRGGYSGVQPGGDRRVAEIVGAPGQQGCRLLAGEGRSAGLVEDQQVGPVIEDAPTRAGEDAPVRPGRELLEVLAEQRDQFGMKRHRAGLPAWAVLELAALAGRSAVGPPGA